MCYLLENFKRICGSPRDPQPLLYESKGDTGSELHNTDGRVKLPNEGTHEVTDSTQILNIDVLSSMSDYTRLKRRLMEMISVRRRQLHC